MLDLLPDQGKESALLNKQFQDEMFGYSLKEQLFNASIICIFICHPLLLDFKKLCPSSVGKI